MIGMKTTPFSSTQVKQKQQSTPSGSMVVAEVDINDVPIGCRNLLTKGSTQDEISKMSGAAISTRGRYMLPEDKARATPNDRPLYLFVQGQTQDMINKAVDRINTMIANAYKNRNPKFAAPNTNQVRPKVPSLSEVNLSQPPPLMSLTAQPHPHHHPPPQGPPLGPPPQVTVYQEKVMIGLEHAPPTFEVKPKVVGPEDSFIQHIYHETGAKISLRGRNSGFPEAPGAIQEPMHLFLEHEDLSGLEAAKNLAVNLIQTVQQEYAQFQQALAAMPPPPQITPLPTLMNSVPQQIPSSGGLVQHHAVSMATLTQPPPVYQPMISPAMLQQPPPMGPPMSTPPPGLQLPSYHQQGNVPMSVNSQPVYVSSGVVNHVVSQPQFTVPQPPTQLHLVQPVVQEQPQYIQAQPAQPPPATLHMPPPVPQPMPQQLAVQPPQSFTTPPPGQPLTMAVQPQLQGPPPGFVTGPPPPMQGPPPPQVHVVQQVAQPLPGQPIHRQIMSQEPMQPLAPGATATLLVERPLSQPSPQMFAPGEQPPGGPGQPLGMMITAAGSSAPQVVSVQISAPTPANEPYAYTQGPPPAGQMFQPAQGTIYTSMPPPQSLQQGSNPPSYAYSPAPSTVTYTVAGFHQEPSLSPPPQGVPSIISEHATRPLSETYYQQYLPNPEKEAGGNKRKFKEEKEEEDIPDNILAYQHGRPHEVNLMNRAPPPPPPNRSSPVNSLHPTGVPPPPPTGETGRKEIGHAGDGDRKLMPPPPPPPPVSSTGSGHSPVQDRPPPPPQNGEGDMLEPDKKKMKVTADDMKKEDSYTYGQYAAKPQLYSEYQYHSHHPPPSSSPNSAHRPPPPPVSGVPTSFEGQYLPPPPPPYSGAPPPPPQYVQHSTYYGAPPPSHSQQSVMLQPPPHVHNTGPPPVQVTGYQGPPTHHTHFIEPPQVQHHIIRQYERPAY